MSNSLVHKSLELISDMDLHRTRKGARNNDCAPHGNQKFVADHGKNLYKEQKKKKKHTHIKYRGALDLIPSKHRVLSTYDDADVSTIMSRSHRTTVYETRKRITAQKDPTDDNIKKLLLLSSNSLKSEITSNLLQRATKKRYSQKEEKPKELEKTAFTEEDFKKFEQEYVD